MFLLSLLVLFAIYGLVVLGCTVILRLIGVPSRWMVLLGFLLFGVVIGLLVVWEWPLDIITVHNLPAALLGYEVYKWSIQLIGDPTSPNAHETIPWFLRIPQVLAIVSAFFWGLLGLLVQSAINSMHSR
jgi:hypothetical protein